MMKILIIFLFSFFSVSAKNTNELNLTLIKNKNLKKNTELLTDNSSKYLNNRVTYHLKNKYQKAITSLKKSIELNPKDPVAYRNLGNVYLLMKQYQKAIPPLEKSIELNSNDTNNIILGYIYYLNNKPYKAVYYYINGILASKNIIDLLKIMQLKDIETFINKLIKK